MRLAQLRTDGVGEMHSVRRSAHTTRYQPCSGEDSGTGKRTMCDRRRCTDQNLVGSFSSSSSGPPVSMESGSRRAACASPCFALAMRTSLCGTGAHHRREQRWRRQMSAYPETPRPENRPGAQSTTAHAAGPALRRTVDTTHASTIFLISSPVSLNESSSLSGDCCCFRPSEAGRLSLFASPGEGERQDAARRVIPQRHHGPGVSLPLSVRKRAAAAHRLWPRRPQGCGCTP